jgi:hypothetical protein
MTDGTGLAALAVRCSEENLRSRPVGDNRSKRALGHCFSLGMQPISGFGQIHFFGGKMWKGIQRRFYSMMYYFGKTPPPSAEIDAAFEKLGEEATIAADDPLCDCQVLANSTTIQCKTRRTSACEALGELRPDVNTVTHKVGFCSSLREGSR